MTVQEWLKENWPLALAGAVGLLGIILYLRSSVSGTQAVTVGPTPQEVQAAETTRQVELQTTADVRKAYFNSLEGLVVNLAGAEAAITKAQVESTRDIQIAQTQTDIARVNAQAAQNLINAQEKGRTTRAIFSDLPQTLEAIREVFF